MGHGGGAIEELLRRARLRLPVAMPGLEAPLVRRLRRLAVGTLGVAAVGFSFQVLSAAMGWRAYFSSPGGHALGALRHWLARYVALDSLLPVCLLLAEPFDPAQPLMCAFVAAGSISLRFRDLDLAWRASAPESWSCAAVALVLGSCGAICLMAVAVCACAVGRHVLRLHLAYGPAGPALRQALAKISSVPVALLPQGLECAICLEACGDSSAGGEWCELQCKHRFHRACLFKWLQRQRCCPLCRWNLHASLATTTIPCPSGASAVWL